MWLPETFYIAQYIYTFFDVVIKRNFALLFGSICSEWWVVTDTYAEVTGTNENAFCIRSTSNGDVSVQSTIENP